MKKMILLFLLFIFPALSEAKPQMGINLHYAAISTEPDDMHGGQLMFTYDPQRFQWRKFNVYFDAGITYFWVSHSSHHKSIVILSAAPVARYTFNSIRMVKPYIDISIGVAYLNQLQLGHRNLGMHFSFQDRVGLGVLMGSDDQFSIGVQAVHYSNGSLCRHNSGLSIPLMLDVGYRFK